MRMAQTIVFVDDVKLCFDVDDVEATRSSRYR
jgi:hypothetical protein